MSTIAKAFAERAAKVTGEVEFGVEIQIAPVTFIGPEAAKPIVVVTIPRSLLDALRPEVELDLQEAVLFVPGTGISSVVEPVPNGPFNLTDEARELLDENKLRPLRNKKIIHDFDIGEVKEVKLD